MAATLSLDTITSSGSTITVPTGKTLAITDDVCFDCCWEPRSQQDHLIFYASTADYTAP